MQSRPGAMPGGVRTAGPAAPARPGGAPPKAKPPSPRRTPTKAKRAKAPEPEPLLSLDTKLDILGVGLIIIALITLLSFLSQSPGAVTRVWLRFIFRTFGWGGYLVPLGLAAVGVWLIWRHFGDQLPPVEPVRIVGGVVLFLGLLTLLHGVLAALRPIGPVYYDPSLADPANPAYTPTLVWEQAQACPTDPQRLVDLGWRTQNAYLGSYDIASCGHGGGYIGAFIQVNLSTLLGGASVFVLALAAMIGGGMMAAKLTLKEALQLGRKGYEWVRDRRSATAKPTAYKRTEKGELVPVKEKEEAGEKPKIPTPAKADEGEKGEEKPTPAPLPGRPSVVTGRGPAGAPTASKPGAPPDEEKPGVKPREAPEPATGRLPAAPPRPGTPSGLPGVRTEAKPPGVSAPAKPAEASRPSGLPGSPAASPRPGSPPAPAPSRPGSPPSAGPRPPGGAGPLAGVAGRPREEAKADQKDRGPEKDEDAGNGQAGQQAPPKPGLPGAQGVGPSPTAGPATKPVSSATVAPPPRPGPLPGAAPDSKTKERTFGPPPPASLGGPRPVPRPGVPTRRKEEDEDDLVDTLDTDTDIPSQDEIIKELIKEDKPSPRAPDSKEETPSAKEGRPSQPPEDKKADKPEAKVGEEVGKPDTPQPKPLPLPAVEAKPAPAVSTAVPRPAGPPRIESKAPEDGKPGWPLPSVGDMLEITVEKTISDEELRRRAEIIEQTLSSFGAPGRVVEVNHGPVITQFGVEPDYIDGRAGKRIKVKVGKISALSDDLALALAAPTIRVEAPVPGKGYVGIEVPNAEPSIVGLRDVMDTPEFRNLRSPLKLALGQDVSGHPVVADLTAMPHLLIAGTTGSGKSVCVNGIISTMLMTCTPDMLQVIMVDPKRVELTNYNGIPHLMAPVVTELERIVGVLKWVQREMDERYRKFAMAGARNITDYNSRVERGQIKEAKKLPYILVIVDELADLMMLAPDETERVVTRLAQMARATGIHIIISTQRPSVDVVTGLIKANFPARIAFAVATGVDSRVILDMPGAEKLLGRGDMLFQAPDAPMPLRMQGVFVSDKEIQKLVDFWRKQAAEKDGAEAVAGRKDKADTGQPTQRALFPVNDEDGDGDADDLFDEAVELVRGMEKASISLLQRHLRIGYTRAARLIDIMEERGVIGPHEGGSKPRVVLGPDGEPLGDVEDEEED